MGNSAVALEDEGFGAGGVAEILARLDGSCRVFDVVDEQRLASSLFQADSEQAWLSLREGDDVAGPRMAYFSSKESVLNLPGSAPVRTVDLDGRRRVAMLMGARCGWGRIEAE